MSGAAVVIYGIAALWAVQILLALMARHRRQVLARLQHAELNRREANSSSNAASPDAGKAADSSNRVATPGH